MNNLCFSYNNKTCLIDVSFLKEVYNLEPIIKAKFNISNFSQIEIYNNNNLINKNSNISEIFEFFSFEIKVKESKLKRNYADHNLGNC